MICTGLISELGELHAFNSLNLRLNRRTEAERNILHFLCLNDFPFKKFQQISALSIEHGSSKVH